MKKIFLPIIFILSFFLSSCDKAEVNEPQFPLSVNGKVEAEYYFSYFSADIKTEEDSTLTLTVTKPKLLKDWIIVLNSDGTKIQNSSLSLDYEDDQLEKICPLVQLYDILEALNTQKPKFVLFSESYSADFEYEGEKCVVVVNAESGMVEKISTQDCVFTFKNEEVVTG